MLKDERRTAVRMIKRIHADPDARSMLDLPMYEPRGLESHLSLDTRLTIIRKRRNVLQAVLNEQHRQRTLTRTQAQTLSTDKQREEQNDDDGGDDVCLRLSRRECIEWFRHRALGFAEQDARDAREYQSEPHEVVVPCDVGIALLHESLHESFCIMDIEDWRAEENSSDNNNNNSININAMMNDNSTLQYWANSSWTRVLMEE